MLTQHEKVSRLKRLAKKVQEYEDKANKETLYQVCINCEHRFTIFCSCNCCKFKNTFKENYIKQWEKAKAKLEELFEEGINER